MVAPRLAAILAAVFLAWAALPGTFVFDDHSLFGDPAVVNADAWRRWISVEQTRPLTYASFWLDYHIWGARPFGFRMTNLAIHLAAAWMVFVCVRRLRDEAAAMWAALFFAFHPLCSEPLFYVFARSSSLAALACLATLWLWLRERWWAAVAAFTAALLAKEEWAAFPVALALLPVQRYWPAIAAMCALSLAAGLRVIYATRAVAGAGSGFDAGISPWQYFLAQGQVIWSYFARIVAPVGFSIDPPAVVPDLERGLLGWVVLAAGLAALWWFRSRAAEWVTAAVILLLPSSSIFPAADAVAFRRMYLPMAIVAGLAGIWLARRRMAALAVVAALATLLGFRAVRWSSEVALWQEAVENAPGKARPLLQLARLAEPAAALGYLDRAEALGGPESTVAEIASLRGGALLRMGRPAEALSAFGRALAKEPGQARYVLNRGVALSALGQTDAAKADFERALRMDPCLSIARENLIHLGGQAPSVPAQCASIDSARK